MPLNYQIFDVFVSTPFAGNPLAVVDMRVEAFAGERFPSDDALLRIAREFNLSDTIFLCHPENDVHSTRLRILTPDRELPFAGHPTVGAAVALSRASLAEGLSDGLVLLETAIGAIRAAVSFEPDDPDRNRGFGEFDLLHLPRRYTWSATKAEIALALGLDPGQVGFENHLPTVFDGALPYHLVPVRDQAALASVKPKAAAIDKLLGMSDRPPGVFEQARDSLYVYTRDAVAADADFSARKLWPENGVVEEDPATGSAVASLAGAIHLFDAPMAGLHRLSIEQGVTIGRPSRLTLEVQVGEDGGLQRVRLGGEAILIGEGTLLWP
ncbi:MAG: PhzF family phenazine biosynthesis protein [Pseudomonadota bacterium]